MTRDMAVQLLNETMIDLSFYRSECRVVALTSGYETAFTLLTEKLKEMDDKISAALDDAEENVTTKNVNAYLKTRGVV
jgi:hypothetical protein